MHDYLLLSFGCKLDVPTNSTPELNLINGLVALLTGNPVFGKKTATVTTTGTGTGTGASTTCIWDTSSWDGCSAQ
ncbi:MAG: hypothetical protein KBF93_16850 [Leptospiraceae bacterium]|nr:hypothetical protein [Leptospiraceae bacterium]